MEFGRKKLRNIGTSVRLVSGWGYCLHYLLLWTHVIGSLLYIQSIWNETSCYFNAGHRPGWTTGIWFVAGVWFFHSSSRSYRAWVPPPAIQWVQRIVFPGLKRSELEADHSSPSRIMVKNGRRFASARIRGNYLYLFDI